MGTPAHLPVAHPGANRKEQHPADTGALLEQLSFITDVKQWGVPFRQGLFEISADDFAIIRDAMTGSADA